MWQINSDNVCSRRWSYFFLINRYVYRHSCTHAHIRNRGTTFLSPVSSEPSFKNLSATSLSYFGKSLLNLWIWGWYALHKPAADSQGGTNRGPDSNKMCTDIEAADFGGQLQNLQSWKPKSNTEVERDLRPPSYRSLSRLLASEYESVGVSGWKGRCARSAGMEVGRVAKEAQGWD